MAMTKYERLVNGEEKPSEEEIRKTIGKKALQYWEEMKGFLYENYDFPPELTFYGKKYGWTIRYRKSGKTLCSLFPEKGSFTVLLTLGAKEIERGKEQISNLSAPIKEIFDKSPLLHDGKWLWIRVEDRDCVKAIKVLLTVKHKPKWVKR